MSTLLSRADLRDWVRRGRLGITPPIDNVPGAVAGQQPTYRPDPTNPVLNQAITEALAEVNKIANVRTNMEVEIPVAAQTQIVGPTTVSLLDAGGAGRNGLNHVTRVVWDNGTNTPFPLQATTYQKQDQRQDRLWNNYDALGLANCPAYYFIVGYTMTIFPSPNVAGTLRIYATTTLLSPTSDGDYITDLPLDYTEDIITGVACRYWMMRSDDTDSQTKLNAWLPRWEAGKAAITEWYQSLAGDFQPSLTYEGNRRQRGNRRIRTAWPTAGSVDGGNSWYWDNDWQG